jgi:hypothetical protein
MLMNSWKAVQLRNGLICLAIWAVASGVGAQSSSERNPFESFSDAREFRGGQSGVFAVVPSTPKNAGRAVQFRVHYDPRQVQVLSTDDCLVNLPDDLLSNGLNACRVNHEGSFVQVVISHLDKDGSVPADLEIGIIEFERIAGGSAAGNEVSIEDVHVTNAMNPSKEIEVKIEKIDY